MALWKKAIRVSHFPDRCGGRGAVHDPGSLFMMLHKQQE